MADFLGMIRHPRVVLIALSVLMVWLYLFATEAPLSPTIGEFPLIAIIVFVFVVIPLFIIINYFKK